MTALTTTTNHPTMATTTVVLARGDTIYRSDVLCVPVGEHLAVTPAVTVRDGQIVPVGGWHITHRPTGTALRREGTCFACASEPCR